MSNEKFTPGPWRQGITLATPRTRRWTAEQIEKNNAIERRMIFSNFTAADSGIGRQLIAQVLTSDADAALAAAAPDMLAALERMERQILRWAEQSANRTGYVEIPLCLLDDLRETVRACIKKAKGE